MEGDTPAARAAPDARASPGALVQTPAATHPATPAVHGGTLSEPAAPATPAAVKLTDPQQVLEGVFGYREFRPAQA